MTSSSTYLVTKTLKAAFNLDQRLEAVVKKTREAGWNWIQTSLRWCLLGMTVEVWCPDSAPWSWRTYMSLFWPSTLSQGSQALMETLRTCKSLPWGGRGGVSTPALVPGKACMSCDLPWSQPTIFWKWQDGLEPLVKWIFLKVSPDAKMFQNQSKRHGEAYTFITSSMPAPFLANLPLGPTQAIIFAIKALHSP